MLATVAATWYVASPQKNRRNVAFLLFLSSNVLWAVWGLHAHAYALIVLQICLAVMNVRGAMKTEQAGLSSKST